MERIVLALIELFAVSASAAPSLTGQTSCNAKYLDANASSFVCVCDASSCDTLPRLPLPAVGSYAWVQSDIEQFRFHHTEHSFVTEFAASADIMVKENTDKQEVIGLGGSITDSAALNILSLSPDAQENLIKSYFSEDGIEYSLVRTNIGGCDFSTRGYTLLDTEGDENLDTFALQPEDLDYKIPVFQRAMEVSPDPIKVVGAAWTAPAWMKNGNSLKHGTLKRQYYQAWAEYHVRFLEEYSARNISFWGISGQNEPIDGLFPSFSFNSMGWTPRTQKKFIGSHLGPHLHERGFEDLKVLLLDDQRFFLPDWPQKMVSEPAVDNYTHGVALHWYTNLFEGPEVLDETHSLMPDKFLLSTEACEGFLPYSKKVFLGSWERLESYASDIIQSFEHWVAGWIDWNMALDLEGGPNWCNNFVDSPVIVNKEADEFYKNPMFYAMGHFSKFIRPGAEHLQTEALNGTELQFTAFRNTDGSSALVLLNKLAEKKEVNINIEGKGSIQQTVAARSLNTFVFE